MESDNLIQVSLLTYSESRKWPKIALGDIVFMPKLICLVDFFRGRWLSSCLILQIMFVFSAILSPYSSMFIFLLKFRTLLWTMLLTQRKEMGRNPYNPLKSPSTVFFGKICRSLVNFTSATIVLLLWKFVDRYQSSQFIRQEFSFFLFIFFFVIFCKPLSFNLCELLSPPPPEQNSKAGWKETESLTQRLLRQDPVCYVRIPSDWNNQESR